MAAYGSAEGSLLDWPRSLFGFFSKIIWKNPNKLHGQPTILQSRTYLPAYKFLTVGMTYFHHVCFTHRTQPMAQLYLSYAFIDLTNYSISDTFLDKQLPHKMAGCQKVLVKISPNLHPWSL